MTPEDVQRVAAAYLKTSNRTLGMFIPTAKPERAEIPATPDIAAALKDYKGDAVIAAGEAFDPSPTNIEARTTRSAVGTIKTAFLPKKTRGNTVVARIAGGACSGCRISLPDAIRRRAMSPATLVQCPNCGRILAAS